MLIKWNVRYVISSYTLFSLLFFFPFFCVHASHFWLVSNSETRQSILLPETKADMLCLSVLGWMKAHELRNTLTLQRCARLLLPDRPPNLWKTFLRGFDCYDVNVASDAMKTSRLLQTFGRSCGILSRGFLTVLVCFSLVASEVLPVSWCPNTCAERIITHSWLSFCRLNHKRACCLIGQQHNQSC